MSDFTSLRCHGARFQLLCEENKKKEKAEKDMMVSQLGNTHRVLLLCGCGLSILGV